MKSFTIYAPIHTSSCHGLYYQRVKNFTPYTVTHKDSCCIKNCLQDKCPLQGDQMWQTFAIWASFLQFGQQLKFMHRLAKFGASFGGF